MPRFVLIAVLFLSSFSSFAQISTPEKRKFNVGIYAGLSVFKYKPMVAIDLSYKGTTLRLMPNYQYNAVGITQEILKISPVFYNIYWTASAYAGYGTQDMEFATNPSSNFTQKTYTGILTTGVKTYFAKRLYTHVMAGVMYNQFSGGNASQREPSNLIPYFEFGLGFLFLKTYPKLKREETEE
ncbi:MAG TPA: hypothetical protein VK766_01045 [Cytophagaceae bacterium]|jgi:hypothetical protein|nr:hypothetical protein [Cytophagaceae bacterium]